jgi:hypothetical protein
MYKQVLAVAASAFLLGHEAASEAEKFDPRHGATMDAPHSHIEMAEGSFIDVTSGFSFSGGQSDETRYYLRLAPAYVTDANGKQQLIGYRAFGTPDSGTQQMYGQFETLDSALSSLESELGLLKPQLESTRHSLLTGNHTEIGGHGARLFLREETLRELGLTFRPFEA